MKILKARLIVVELERVETIRKEARTQVVACPRCGRESDFVALTEAARLFETEAEALLRFVSDQRCHFQTDNEGSIFLCLTSLLEKMRIRSVGDRPQLPS